MPDRPVAHAFRHQVMTDADYVRATGGFYWMPPCMQQVSLDERDTGMQLYCCTQVSIHIPIALAGKQLAALCAIVLAWQLASWHDMRCL